ncbi:unnamed protein product [Amaranthus hypochondriacus]
MARKTEGTICLEDIKVENCGQCYPACAKFHPSSGEGACNNATLECRCYFLCNAPPQSHPTDVIPTKSVPTQSYTVDLP